LDRCRCGGCRPPTGRRGTLRGARIAWRWTARATWRRRTPPSPATLRWFAEGGSLAQALFTGRSLPRELRGAAGGGAASVHHVSRQARGIPDLPSPVWRDVLTLLDRLPPQRRPSGSWQWDRLAALARDVAQTIDPHDLNARTVAIDAMFAGTQRLALGRTVDRARDHGWQGLLVDGD
jgi:hypothetical protein